MRARQAYAQPGDWATCSVWVTRRVTDRRPATGRGSRGRGPAIHLVDDGSPDVTDVAARGLQIDNLDMVINYDLPLDCENYVHRIGRTARAGNSGKAISLASEGTAKQLDAIESFIGMKIPVLEADIDNFTRDKSQELESQRYARKRPKHHRAGIHPRNIKRYA